MLDSAPITEDELFANLSDWHWRITSGHLYKIKAKSETDDPDDPEAAGIEIPFIPNAAQRMLLADLHNRNVILKARQMGFSTLIEIMALDHALFNKDQSVVVIADTLPNAEKLMRTKIKYAYDRLPELLRERMPTSKRNDGTMIFAHNESTIEVTASARGGTVNFLHVSEMGKIAAKFPEKAREINTGSLQTVPASGLCFIESTAEGQDGAFYTIARRAEGNRLQNKVLNSDDYHFHFFAWWMDPAYTMNHKFVPISLKEHDYFDNIEDLEGITLNIGQRAWYVNKRTNDFEHEPELMWREYPSTAAECWASGNEGKYLIKQVQRARATGRIGNFPISEIIPSNTFWDLGVSDDTVCWVHQRQESWDYFHNYREGAGEGLIAFIHWLESLGLAFDTHYLPHDASARKLDIEDPRSIISQLRELKPSWKFEIVPRVSNIQHGVDLLRNDFATYRFHEENTKEGVLHLENYAREYNTRLQSFTNVPKHDDHSHAADAIRQKAQAYQVGSSTKKLTPRTSAQRSGLAA